MTKRDCIHLLVKGTIADCYTALLAHRIPLDAVVSAAAPLDGGTEHEACTVVVRPGLEGVATDWFCEPPVLPPFPPGTLLYYGPARDLQVEAAGCEGG